MLMNFLALLCIVGGVVLIISLGLAVLDMIECRDFQPMYAVVGIFIALLMIAAILDFNGVHLA